jgi:hypothetical protein
MSSRDQGLTKAEKRWQRHLLKGKTAPQAGTARPVAEEVETLEDREVLRRFGQKLEAGGTLKASAVTMGVAAKRYGVKLSAALLDVCQPLLDTAEGDPERIRKCVKLGIIGWNLAFMPDASVDDLLSPLAASAGNGPDAKEAVRMLRAAVENSKARKLKLYPEINMFIMEHEVVFHGSSMQVNVAGAEVPTKAAPRRKGLLGRMRGLIR